MTWVLRGAPGPGGRRPRTTPTHRAGLPRPDRRRRGGRLDPDPGRRVRRALAAESSGRCRSSALGFGLVLTLIARQPPVPARQPEPAPDDRFFERVPECVAAGGDLDRGQRDRVSLRRPAHRPDPRADLLALVDDLNQLTSLEQPVTFTMIFGRGHRAIRQRDRVVQLLESYKAANPRMIQLVSLDPYQRPDADRRAGQARSGARAAARRRRRDRVRRGRRRRSMSWCATRTCFSRSRSTRARRPGSLCVGLYGRGRDHIGTDATEGGQEVEGRVHHRARRAARRAT